MASGTLVKSPGEAGVWVPGGRGIPLGCGPRSVDGSPGSYYVIKSLGVRVGSWSYHLKIKSVVSMTKCARHLQPVNHRLPGPEPINTPTFRCPS